MNGQQAGNADALDEQLAHAVAGGFGSNHHDVHVVRQHDLAVMDAEAVSDHEGAARLEVGLDLLPVYAALNMVGYDHHDHVGLGCHFGHVGNSKAGRLCRCDAGTAGIETHHHVLAVVLQIQRVGVALAAVTDNADGLTLQGPQVGVLVVVDVYHRLLFRP